MQFLSLSMYIVHCAVIEIIIGAPKKQNNFGGIKLFIYPILR